ncbi:MAG: tetratricopeptide repeat protein [Candidatus Zhuqueibacterota bacterium]
MTGIVLHWIVTNVPALLPVFIVIFISAIFVLIYLYRTAEMMNKKILAWLMISFTAIFVTAIGYYLIKNRPPHVDFRLQIFPMYSEAGSPDSDWPAKQLWDAVSNELIHSVHDRAIVSPADWTASLTANDSAVSIDHFKNLSLKIGGDFFLTGSQKREPSVATLTWKVYNSKTGEVVVQEAQPVIAEKLAEDSHRICVKILAGLNSSIEAKSLAIAQTTPENFQNYWAARERFDQEKYGESAVLAAQVVSLDSNFVPALVLSGKSWFFAALAKKKSGASPVEEFDHTRNYFTRAMVLDSTQAEAMALLGEYYIYQERWSLAEHHLLNSFRLNPHYPRLYLTMSRLHPFRYKKIGFDTERQLFQRAIFIDPCYEDGYLMLSDHYLFDNKREKAIESLERYLVINPDAVPVLTALGRLYVVRNDMMKIVEVYDKIIALQPNNSDAFYNLGILYYNSEDLETSEKLLQRAIAIDNHLNAHLFLAFLYEARGDREKAIEHFRYRIRNRKGLEDEFAEEARKHLFILVNQDSTQQKTNEQP